MRDHIVAVIIIAVIAFIVVWLCGDSPEQKNT